MPVTRRVPKVLFLIADTGGGHRSAANAIRAAMDLIAPEAFTGYRPATYTPIDVSALPFAPASLIPRNWGGVQRPWQADIHDVFQECGPLPLRQTANLYGPTVEKRPFVYASLWHATNTRATYAALTVLTQSFLRRGLLDLLYRIRPDVIVSVHSLLTQPALKLIGEIGVNVPVLLVITDLVKIHRSWATPGVDACSVPTEEAKEYVIAHGMNPQTVHLLGMPIHPKFCLPPANRIQIHQELNLVADRPTILLVGGGDGVGGIGEAALALSNAELPVQLIVICGRNQALYERLRAAQHQLKVPCAILGFVQNMPDLMHASDLIITKAGPGTIMEALACELPIILTGAIPGQEVGNINYVVDHGVGVLAPTPDDIVAAVQQLLEQDHVAFDAMRAQARKLGNKHAAFDIARLILERVPASRSISEWGRSPRTTMQSIRATRRLRRWTRRSRSVPSLLRLGALRRVPRFLQIRGRLR